MSRAVRRIVLAVVALIVVAGCAEAPAPDAQTEAIRVGAFDFPESELLAEIYAQALEARGLPVERLGRIGSREVVLPALQLGFIDVVPEYAGSILTFVSLGTNEPTADSEQTLVELQAALDARGIVALDPSAAQNRNAIVVTKRFAIDHEVRALSDLRSIATDLTMGGPPECPERAFCLVGLSDVYGLEFGSFVPLPNTSVVADALRTGEIDVGLLFSTDAALADPDLVVLRDDRGLQPAENVVPVVRASALRKWGSAFTDALDSVSDVLVTTDLAQLNSLSQSGMGTADLANEWLSGGLDTSV